LPRGEPGSARAHPEEHPDEAATPSGDTIVEYILKHLLEELEDPRKAAAGREFRRRSMGIHEEEDVDLREGLQSLASLTASKYWAHVTAGHATPQGSSDGYLGDLAKRVRR
jgi:hypothetical protein